MLTSRSTSFAAVSTSARMARLRVRRRRESAGSRRLFECTARRFDSLLAYKFMGEFSGQIRRIAPKSLQAVEAAGVFREDVEDEVAVVEKDPAAGGRPFDEQRLDLHLRPQRLLHRVGDGCRLPFIAG